MEYQKTAFDWILINAFFSAWLLEWRHCVWSSAIGGNHWTFRQLDLRWGSKEIIERYVDMASENWIILHFASHLLDVPQPQWSAEFSGEHGSHSVPSYFHCSICKMVVILYLMCDGGRLKWQSSVQRFSQSFCLVQISFWSQRKFCLRPAGTST